MENNEPAKRVTKGVMLAFIERVEGGFAYNYQPSAEWQALRQAMGLPVLTRRMVLARAIDRIRSYIDSGDLSKGDVLQQREEVLRLEAQLLEMDRHEQKKKDAAPKAEKEEESSD